MARIHPAPGREVRGHVADDSGLSRAHVLTLGVLAHRLLFRLRVRQALVQDLVVFLQLEAGG